MKKIFLTSDFHDHHKNIIKYCNRPFEHTKEMGEAMITYHNELVKPQDVVYILGDIGMGDVEPFVKQLNGNLHLILGNHDHRDNYHKYFQSVNSYLELRMNKNKIILFHYPIAKWNGCNYGNDKCGSFHFYGHSHGNFKNGGRSMDVGVDTNNFRPYNLDEVIEKLLKIPIHTFGREMEYNI